jgi:uncharacterized protein (DUF2132 family)
LSLGTHLSLLFLLAVLQPSLTLIIMNTSPCNQINNPLHGITLATMLSQLIECYGYPGLAARIPVRCFSHEPSLASSLKFLRKTPWARAKVESLYLATLTTQDRP